MGKGILSRLIFVANEHPYYTQGSMWLGLKFGTAQGDFISKSKLLEVKRIVGQWKHEVGGIFTLLDFVQVIQTGLCSEQWFACGLAVSVSS